MKAMTQTAAKRDLISICRCVSSERRRAYVEDKAGDWFLTIDHKERDGTGPSVPVTT